MVKATTGATKSRHAKNTAATDSTTQVAIAKPSKNGPSHAQVRNGSSVDVKASKPPPQATLPEVRSLIIKYKPNRGSEVTRPAERLLKPLVEIDAILSKSTDAKELAKQLSESPIRTPLFQLEGLLRLYENKLGKRFEKALVNVKELEDQLGAVGFLKDALAQAKAAELPAATQSHLQGKIDEQLKKLEKIIDERWKPDPDKRMQAKEVDNLVGTFMDAELGTHAQDQSYLRGELARRMQKVVDTTYDFNDLQGGVHELRRNLRWLPIYMSALDGAIQLSPEKNSLPALKPLLKTPGADSPFLKTAGTDREPTQIVLSKSLMVAQGDLIKDLGEFKDTGEYMHALSEAMVAAGDAKTLKEAEAFLAPKLGGESTATFLDDSKKAYEAFTKLGVMPALVAELKG